MELFRIAKKRYKHDISGMGASISGGRWNHKGQRVLYTAESRSLAMLESIVHITSSNPNQEDYTIMVIYIPDEHIGSLLTPKDLRKDWKTDLEITRKVGEKWLKAEKDLILGVPSVIVKNEYNYLLNPLHPEYSKIQIIDFEPFEFDMRLFSHEK